MQTKSYTNDLLPLVKALCGVEFATVELPRIRAMVNRRAKRAYRASNYWTRFLKIGEERTVTNNLIPFTQSGLDSIDTFLRIHKQNPYQTASVQEFDIMVTASGATIIAGTLAPTSAWVTYKKQFTDTYGDGTGGTTDTVPDEWFEYLAHGTYSDFMRAEGQQEKAAIADQEALDILQDELMRLDEQHTQTIVSQRIMTNANMQLRY
jgi:hypothetical protein